MNVVLTIEGREAIPLRAVAYVCYWNAEPNEIASACATPPTKEIGGYSIRNRHSLPTYLVSRGAHRPMQPVEWEPFLLELECLEKGLKADERTDDENWARCRKQAVLQLPDGAFVWLDEFQRWFSNTRPLKDAVTLSNDGEDDSFENESDSLNLDPFIPPELREAIFSGLERYLVADREAAVEGATEGGADDNHEPRLIDRNEVIGKFQVKADSEENFKFWNSKLGQPPEWLKLALGSVGKPGESSMWKPLVIAHCLVGGHKWHKKPLMTLQQLDVAIHKGFPEWLETWREETQDKR